jgi:hypothetical protein
MLPVSSRLTSPCCRLHNKLRISRKDFGDLIDITEWAVRIHISDEWASSSHDHSA